MRNRRMALASGVSLFLALSLGCSVLGKEIAITSPQSPTNLTATATRTYFPRESIDFNATVIAATVQARGGYIETSTPLPVFPTATSTPFNQLSFLATINAQFAQATETAYALATPTFTPSPTAPSTPTPPPPVVLPPAGGEHPDTSH
jgi:hypothetical protein